MKYDKTDFENLQVSACNQSLVQDFLDRINGDTLGRKVSIALNQRQQGHFDKAMLNISEANRDQVLAIREIQSILDRLDEPRETELIFENYNQIFPFKIGLKNGDAVLNLFNYVNSVFNDGFSKIITELHDFEDEFGLLTEECTFLEERMSGQISEKELDVIKEKISILDKRMASIKKYVLENLFGFVDREYGSAGPDDRLRLIKALYLVLTSSIETRDAGSRSMSPT